MDVQEWRGEFVEQEDRRGKVDERPVSQREYRDSTDRMRHHTPPEDINMQRAYAEIPKEVAERETLAESSISIITPQTSLPPFPRRLPPDLTLLIEPDCVETQGINDACLDEANDVDVPVEFRPAAQARISVGREAGGDEGRDDCAGEGVYEGGEEDFVDV